MAQEQDGSAGAQDALPSSSSPSKEMESPGSLPGGRSSARSARRGLRLDRSRSPQGPRFLAEAGADDEMCPREGSAMERRGRQRALRWGWTTYARLCDARHGNH